MKKYIILHYTQGGYYRAGLKKWYGWRFIRVFSNGHFLEPRNYSTKFDTLRQAETAIRTYHEQRYRSTVRGLEFVVNELRYKREKVRREQEKGVSIEKRSI